MLIKEKETNTLGQFTQVIEAVVGGPHEVHWFRGCARADFELAPSLYRHPTIKGISDLLELENRLINRFRQRSAPYQARMSDDWEYLFLMQHFGVPTRLLDWTENPYIALYFALTGACLQHPGTPFDDPPDSAVWVLNPTKWNRFVFRDVTFTGDVLSVGDPELRGYEPKSVMNNNPVALYGTHNSPRIVAQRGVFTIAGRNTTAMEELAQDQEFDEKSLRKIVIPGEVVHSVLDSVLAIGVTESVVFPSLDGLAREMTRTSGFKVWNV